MTHQGRRLAARTPHVIATAATAQATGHVAAAGRAAALTLALSLPQGLLALPIAVAQVGLVPGVMIVLLVGALNTATTAWAARALAAAYAQRGTVPSLTQLAHLRLGPWGGRLTLGGGGALFFLALLSSIVGLARSLAELTGAPAPLWGGGCGLAVLLLVLCRATLGARLLIRLGVLNVALVLALLLVMLPHGRAVTAPVTLGVPPLSLIGVSLMLFFAPMLLAPVASRLLPQGCHPGAFVYGSAAGVAAGTVLFALWAGSVYSVVGAAGLAGAAGTALPALIVAVPATGLPALLLGLLLLGTTALRCALVLAGLMEERLPATLQGPGRRALAQLPAAAGLALALALLCAGDTSFTQLVAVAGIGAASLTSLVVPTLLARRAARPPG